MALPAPKRRYTVEEYLRLEEASTDRHEYHDGEIVAMAGGTYEHSLTTANFARGLGNALKGGPCRVLESNIRVKIASVGRYVYPDVTVVCGPPEFDTASRSRVAIMNPRLIAEVLSDATEAYDRGRKFSYYRDVGSMLEYVLVAQREPMVETFLRRENGDWAIATFRGLDAAVPLRSLNVSIALRDIYDGVTFPPTSDAGPQPGPDDEAGDATPTEP